MGRGIGLLTHRASCTACDRDDLPVFPLPYVDDFGDSCCLCIMSESGFRERMPFYVILGKFTDEGAKHIKDSPKYVAQTRAMVEKVGGKWHGFYYTMGQYDFVAVVEGPSDETALSLLFALSSVGRVRTTTLKAFPTEEVEKNN